MSSAAVQVILVDEADREVGLCEKQDAHLRGLLHRAVSVFLFDAEGRLLVQRRAATKYHSGGQWSNTACTHPRVGESLHDAALRAVREELGGTPAGVVPAFPFTYRADVGGGLVEHEYDHVFVGDGIDGLAPVPDEVDGVAWRDPRELHAELQDDPMRFTPWFRLLLGRVMQWREAQRPRAGEARGR